MVLNKSDEERVSEVRKYCTVIFHVLAQKRCRSARCPSQWCLGETNVPYTRRESSRDELRLCVRELGVLGERRDAVRVEQVQVVGVFLLHQVLDVEHLPARLVQRVEPRRPRQQVHSECVDGVSGGRRRRAADVEVDALGLGRKPGTADVVGQVFCDIGVWRVRLLLLHLRLRLSGVQRVDERLQRVAGVDRWDGLVVGEVLGHVVERDENVLELLADLRRVGTRPHLAAHRRERVHGVLQHPLHVEVAQVQRADHGVRQDAQPRRHAEDVGFQGVVEFLLLQRDHARPLADDRVDGSVADVRLGGGSPGVVGPSGAARNLGRKPAYVNDLGARVSARKVGGRVPRVPPAGRRRSSRRRLSRSCSSGRRARKKSLV